MDIEKYFFLPLDKQKKIVYNYSKIDLSFLYSISYTMNYDCDLRYVEQG